MTPRSLRILLLAGDASLHEALGAMLRQAAEPGMETESSDSVEAGLHRLASEPFDALLLDPVFPEEPKTFALVEVHSHFRWLPVVVLVSRKEEALGQWSLRAGASEYLLKDTLTPELLCSALRLAIERKRGSPDPTPAV
jgi:DNA-binding NarL/FixJ family response regulator